MDDVVELVEGTSGLDRRSARHGPWRRLLRSTIHFFSYHLILKRRTTRVTRAAGFRLIVRPTVFHPRYFITSEFFASFIDRLDLNGKRVADVGTPDCMTMFNFPSHSPMPPASSRMGKLLPGAAIGLWRLSETAPSS
jgi:hypothetical protein